MTHPRNLVTVLLAAVALAGCQSPPPLAPVQDFNVDRYLGDWYVLAHIPPPFTGNAFDATERYERLDARRIATTYRYRKGSFDAPLKAMNSVAFTDVGALESEWGMQFFWPLKMDYRIVYIDEGYEVVIVGRNKRDYLWIMARTPQIPDAQYQALVSRAEAMGYSRADIERVPQQPAGERSAL